MHLARSTVSRAGIVVALLAVTLWFAGSRLADGVSTIDGETISRHGSALLSAMLLFMVATLFLGAAWIVLVESVSKTRPCGRGALMLAFSYSWLGRYVPGTVPFFAGKIYLGSRLGHGKRPLAVATAVQNIIEILVSLTVGVAMIAASQGIAGRGTLLALAILPAGALAALHPRVLRHLVDASLRVLRRDPLPDGALPPARAVALSGTLVACNQVVNGAALFLLLHAVVGTGASGFLLTTGALSLAGVAGILVVLVPAGLGVREGVLTGMLATRVAVESAALIAVLLRLVTVVADLALFAGAFAIDVASGSRVASRAIHAERARTLPAPEPAVAVRRSA